MPIYEYTCKKCDARFERLVKSMSHEESAKVACPQCNSTQTARSMSVFAVSSAGPSGKPSLAAPRMCGRCGGPGPCATG